MNSFSGNNDLRSERLPLWGDNVRLSSIPPIEPASDVAAKPAEPITSTASSVEDEQWDERPSYRRRRDAEDDGRRWRDGTADRGSVWERGATIIEAPERPRRERVSAYLDESSVVRVTRRSSLRSEQQADAGNDSSRGTTRHSARGFSLVSDDAQQDGQREDERPGVNWGYQTDDSFDGDIHAAEAAATARWGHASDDGTSEARSDDARESAATGWGSAFAILHKNTGDARGTAHQRRASEDDKTEGTGRDAAKSTSTTWSDAFAALHEEAGDARGATYQRRSSEDDWTDDTNEAKDSTLRREQPLPADDEAENLGSDAAASRRYTDDTEERGGFWAVVDAICFVPEAVGSFVLGAVGRIRVPGLVVMVISLLVTATLYNPVRDLYLAHRRLDTLQKTYDAVAAQNEQLEREIEVLQTREGIENEARSRGYVEPGETKVIVKGLTTEGGNSTYTITDTELPDDRPWYIKVLDYLLGYDPEA